MSSQRKVMTSEIFSWSGERYSLRHFMDLYGHNLPQIVLVAEGYAGRDELHQFSVEEIYWIKGVQKQARVLLEDGKRRCNSVPLDSPALFQLKKKNGSTTQDLPLQEAIRQYTQHEDLICFSRDEKVKLCPGADRSYTQRLGFMKKLDEYEQKYLVAHSLVEDGVASQKTSIPLYVPIRVKVATGLAGFGDKQFTNYTKALERKVSGFRGGRVKLETGVLQFDGIPEGDYTYVEPIFRTKTDESKHFPSHRKQSTSTTQSDFNQGPRSPVKISHAPHAEDKSDSNDDHDYEEVDERDMVVKSGNLKTSSSSDSGVLPHTVKKSKLLPALKRTTPPVPGPKPVMAAVSPLQPRLVNAPHEIDSEENETPILEAVASLAAAQSERRPWRTVEEIPAKIEDFTVQEVIVCLNLLKLDKLAASMENQCVDGAFLTSLDENIFVNDFNCSLFEARKLDRFIKGWRPKT